MRNKRLSDREFEVMQILWNSSTPLLASDIVKSDSDLNINTVQAAIRKLLSGHYICVADVLQTGKGLGRTFRPTVSVDEYLMTEFQDILPASSERRSLFFSAFMEKADNKAEELDELEKLISDYRKELLH